ncbi:WapI family immunity protein [Priestia aryabhattai]|uniref:WapI family immunity protein n=1 Tax=Priestia aryabhattai TaxID=412384 RepID=UPI003FD763BA
MLSFKAEKVIFEPTELYFGFTLTINRRKNVSVDGFIQYPTGWGTELKFEFKTDLTYIDSFIQGLESILTQYPIKEI